jgi:hypothetical protein
MVRFMQLVASTVFNIWGAILFLHVLSTWLIRCWSGRNTTHKNLQTFKISRGGLWFIANLNKVDHFWNMHQPILYWYHSSEIIFFFESERKAQENFSANFVMCVLPALQRGLILGNLTGKCSQWWVQEGAVIRSQCSTRRCKVCSPSFATC